MKFLILKTKKKKKSNQTKPISLFHIRANNFSQCINKSGALVADPEVQKEVYDSYLFLFPVAKNRDHINDKWPDQLLDAKCKGRHRPDKRSSSVMSGEESH